MHRTRSLYHSRWNYCSAAQRNFQNRLETPRAEPRGLLRPPQQMTEQQCHGIHRTQHSFYLSRAIDDSAADRKNFQNRPEMPPAEP